MRYVFAKGYIAVNGASLTVAEADRAAGWFEVWLIPETLRQTTFGGKAAGDAVHIEIERSTQVVVDTVRDAGLDVEVYDNETSGAVVIESGAQIEGRFARNKD